VDTSCVGCSAVLEENGEKFETGGENPRLEAKPGSTRLHDDYELRIRWAGALVQCISQSTFSECQWYLLSGAALGSEG